MRTLTIATFKFQELNAGAQERALDRLGIELEGIDDNEMDFFSDGTLCPVKNGPCYGDQGNDSLGLAKATITWLEPDATKTSSHELPVNEVTDFCFHLAGQGHCTNILVNGMSEYDYLKQRRGDV